MERRRSIVDVRYSRGGSADVAVGGPLWSPVGGTHGSKSGGRDVEAGESLCSPVEDADKLLGGRAQVSRTRTLETPEGRLVLCSLCPASLIERLRADNGLRAFARLPEREHELLLGIARRTDSALAIAYTDGGEIVGQVTIAPADAYWHELERTYEIAVEVSMPWRRMGVARHLLTLALELDGLAEMIILAMGLSWHWDTLGMGLAPFRYRQMIARLFAAYRFSEYQTSEPNIAMDPANIFLARVGEHIDVLTLNAFFTRLLQFDDLTGLA